MRPGSDSRKRLAGHVVQIRFVSCFVQLAIFVKGNRRCSHQPICQSLADIFAERLEVVHGWHIASAESEMPPYTTHSTHVRDRQQIFLDQCEGAFQAWAHLESR